MLTFLQTDERPWKTYCHFQWQKNLLLFDWTVWTKVPCRNNKARFSIAAVLNWSFNICDIFANDCCINLPFIAGIAWNPVNTVQKKLAFTMSTRVSIMTWRNVFQLFFMLSNLENWNAVGTVLNGCVHLLWLHLGHNHAPFRQSVNPTQEKWKHWIVWVHCCCMTTSVQILPDYTGSTSQVPL